MKHPERLQIIATRPRRVGARDWLMLAIVATLLILADLLLGPWGQE